MDKKNGIKHIEFWVSDIERSLSFYKEIFNILGWEHIEENEFSDGKTKIYFIEQEAEKHKSYGPRHICFLADSPKIIETVEKFLLKGGSEIIRGPVEVYYKNRKSYTIDFKDPDGYILEIATESEIL